MFEPFDLNRLVALDNFISSNAFIARSVLLKDLGCDPRLPLLEDLFLLLHLCRKADFVFSYEATCDLYWRHNKMDNTVLGDRRGRLQMNELRIFCRNKDFLAKAEVALQGVTIRLNRYLDLPVIQAIRRLRRMLFRLPPPPILDRLGTKEGQTAPFLGRLIGHSKSCQDAMAFLAGSADSAAATAATE